MGGSRRCCLASGFVNWEGVVYWLLRFWLYVGGDESEIETRETDTKTRDPFTLAKTLAELSISRFEIAT